MLVYSDLTSIVTRIALGGSGSSESVCLRKSVVSRMYDGKCRASGCNFSSTYMERFSVGESLPDTMGLSGVLSLCIFGSP